MRQRGTDQAAYETQQPLAALRHVASLSTSGLYLFRDFHPFLQDPAVVRTLREFALGAVQQEFGSIERYLESAAGLAGTRREQLRDRLLA